MSSIKKLANQTLWYGVSNIAAKLLNQLLTPITTHILHKPAAMADYGNYTSLMTYISFLNVIYTFGMETAYFRFATKAQSPSQLFNTAYTAHIAGTTVLSLILLLLSQPIANYVGMPLHPEYIQWCVYILAIDTLAALPFAKLRQEERPKKYALVRVAGIVVNILLTLWFIAIYPSLHGQQPATTAFDKWYAAHDNVGFLLLANIGASAFTLLLLHKEWRSFSIKPDKTLLRQMLNYGMPMVVVGIGGMVNETFDRVMLGHLLPLPAFEAAIQVAIYGANYKIAIFITLFITAFRFSAEPFFFREAQNKQAPATYARVMKWFVIVLCFAFLFTALYLDIWKYYIGSTYRSGLGVVPILLAANVCLGIYYNLSVWYKVSDKMQYGMYITLLGAVLTLVSNYIYIPQYGMYACAYTTLVAYGVMMIAGYVLGQKFYPIPYPVGRIVGYLALIAALYFINRYVGLQISNRWLRLGIGTLCMSVFLGVVAYWEKNELQGMIKRR